MPRPTALDAVADWIRDETRTTGQRPERVRVSRAAWDEIRQQARPGQEVDWSTTQLFGLPVEVIDWEQEGVVMPETRSIRQHPWDGAETCPHRGAPAHVWRGDINDFFIRNLQMCGGCAAVRPATWERGDRVVWTQHINEPGGWSVISGEQSDGMDREAVNAAAARIDAEHAATWLPASHEFIQDYQRAQVADGLRRQLEEELDIRSGRTTVLPEGMDWQPEDDPIVARVRAIAAVGRGAAEGTRAQRMRDQLIAFADELEGAAAEEWVPSIVPQADAFQRWANAHAVPFEWQHDGDWASGQMAPAPRRERTRISEHRVAEAFNVPVDLVRGPRGGPRTDGRAEDPVQVRFREDGNLYSYDRHGQPAQVGDLVRVQVHGSETRVAVVCELGRGDWTRGLGRVLGVVPEGSPEWQLHRELWESAQGVPF